MMQDRSTLIHLEYASERSFDEVVARFEAATGMAQGDRIREIATASNGDADAFVEGVRGLEGASGFMRFLDVDHGAWMKILGLAGRAKLYILGNPLIAVTMLRHDIGAALNVPVRVLIVEDPATKAAKLVYDLPSSLMARLGKPELDAAAAGLDEKLAALATLVTGAQA